MENSGIRKVGIIGGDTTYELGALKDMVLFLTA